MELRRRLTLILALTMAPLDASAQLVEEADASTTDASSEGVPPIKMFREPADASATPESAPPRPPPGPAFKERGGRRSRGASTASGALFIAVIAFAVAYYVIKRFRR